MTKPQDIKPHNAKVVPKNPKKPKLEVNSETGVRKGTKKALTFDLAITGLSIDKVIEEVKKTFPEAEPKSIRIWAKKALKQQSLKTA